MYTYGFPSAAKISPPTDEYVLDMPDLQRRLLVTYPGLPPEQRLTVDHEIRTRLPDPVYLPARAPYRYLLRFKNYQAKIPNRARLRLLAEVDGEVTKSRVIHVLTW